MYTSLHQVIVHKSVVVIFLNVKIHSFMAIKLVEVNMYIYIHMYMCNMKSMGGCNCVQTLLHTCRRHFNVFRYGIRMSKSSLCVHLQACMVTGTLSCERNSLPQDRRGSAGSTSLSTSRSTSDVMWTGCLLFVSILFAPIAIGKI